MDFLKIWLLLFGIVAAFVIGVGGFIWSVFWMSQNLNPWVGVVVLILGGCAIMAWGISGDQDGF